MKNVGENYLRKTLKYSQETHTSRLTNEKASPAPGRGHSTAEGDGSPEVNSYC